MNSCQQSIVNYKKKTWKLLGTQPDISNYLSDVFALDSTHVYIGGDFNFYMWNGSSWTTINGLNPITTAGVADYISKIVAIDKNNVYVTGSFINAGNIGIADWIAKWNGDTSRWSAVGSATIDPAMSLYSLHVVSSTKIYAGSNISYNNSSYLYVLNGTTWTSHATSMRYRMSAICYISDNIIYVGGGLNAYTMVKMFNGSTFSTIFSSTRNNDQIDYIVAIDQSHIYISGIFITPNRITNFAMYDGSTFTPFVLPDGVTSISYMTAINNNIYIISTSIDPTYIGFFDGLTWTSLNWTNNDSVRSISVYGSNVYAITRYNIYILE